MLAKILSIAIHCKLLRMLSYMILVLNMVAPPLVSAGNQQIKNDTLPKLNGSNYKEWAMNFVTIVMAADVAVYLLITKGRAVITRGNMNIDGDELLSPTKGDAREIATPSKKSKSKKREKKKIRAVSSSDTGASSEDEEDDNPLLEEVQTRLFSYLHYMIQMKTVKLSVFQNFCQSFIDQGSYPDGHGLWLWLKIKYGNAQLHAQTAMQIEIPEMRQGQHSGNEKASDFALRMEEANGQLQEPFGTGTILNFILR